MGETYNGPYINVALVNGKTHSIKGAVGNITDLLRGGGLHQLEDVYGRPVTVNGDHVVDIEQGPGGAQFEQTG